jgi:hypothetical protein
MDYNCKITNNNNLNLKLNEEKLQELLYNFCHIDSNNEIIIHYKYFKIVNTIIDNNNILNYLVFIIENTLKRYNTFTIHVYIENLTILEIDKNKVFVQEMSTILKEKFPDKLELCYIHNAPFIFKQIYNFLSLLIDKKTLMKIKMKQ